MHTIIKFVFPIKLSKRKYLGKDSPHFIPQVPCMVFDTWYTHVDKTKNNVDWHLSGGVCAATPKYLDIWIDFLFFLTINLLYIQRSCWCSKQNS